MKGMGWEEGGVQHGSQVQAWVTIWTVGHPLGWRMQREGEVWEKMPRSFWAK